MYVQYSLIMFHQNCHTASLELAESTDSMHREWGEHRVKYREKSSFLLLEQVDTTVATAR